MKNYYTLIIKLFIKYIRSAEKKGKLIKKYKVFNEVGENLFYFPKVLPNNPKLLKLGDNVTIAANVIFIDHDVVSMVLNRMGYMEAELYIRPTEVGNNVFIGANSIILPNVRIGNNCLIGAGSIVTKDIPDNSIVAGNPAKIIGNFDSFALKRNDLGFCRRERGQINSVENAWNLFNKQRRTM